MSTTFYLLVVKKKDLWDFIDKSRELEKKNSSYYRVSKMGYKEMMSFAGSEEAEAKLHVYHINGKYYAQVLSELFNLYLRARQEMGARLYFYDNRAQNRDDRKEAFAELLDADRRAKRYYVIPLIDRQTLVDHWFELELEGKVTYEGKDQHEDQ